MEEITVHDGIIYYGKTRCDTADSAYRLFRDDYNRSVNKRRNRQLDRLGNRRERTHGWGMFFETPPEPPAGYEEITVPSRLMGIVATAYCRMIGSWDLPNLDEDDTDTLLDWLCSYGNRQLKRVDRRSGSGRTSKTYKH